MKEDLLRGMIRKQIKSSLKEQNVGSRVTSTLDRVEKMTGVKMLKKALGTGGPQQQAAGLHAVVRAISGDNPLVAKQLARQLVKKGIDTPDAGEVDPTPESPVAEEITISAKDLKKISPNLLKKLSKKMDINIDEDLNIDIKTLKKISPNLLKKLSKKTDINIEEGKSKALDTRMAKVDKTQAMQMLKKTLKNKPASQQASFVADLVKKLDLKGNLTMLIKKIRQVN